MDIFIAHRPGACAKEADDKRIVNRAGMNAELPFAPAVRYGDFKRRGHFISQTTGIASAIGKTGRASVPARQGETNAAIARQLHRQRRGRARIASALR